MKLEEGKYVLEGNQFLVKGKKFVIKSRKNELEKKPKHYLITLPFQYVSSLYPVGKDNEQAYNFDFEHELWELMLKDGIAFIKKVEPFE